MIYTIDSMGEEQVLASQEGARRIEAWESERFRCLRKLELTEGNFCAEAHVREYLHPQLLRRGTQRCLDEWGGLCLGGGGNSSARLLQLKKQFC